MPYISSLKESFATAPIENREDVVLKLAAANTKDSDYYQGLILLQKIYNEVMKQEDPTKVRDATPTERTLSNDMQNHLNKIQDKNENYNELNTRFHLLIYPFETVKATEFIKKELNLDLLTQKQEQQFVEKDESPTKTTTSTLDCNLISPETFLKEIFDNYRSNGDFDITALAFPLVKTSILESNELSHTEQVAILNKLFFYPTEKIFGDVILNHLIRLWKIQADSDISEYKSWKLEDLPFYNFTISQMDYLIRSIPDIVLLHENFVRAYLEKLVPSQYHSIHSSGDTISFWDDNEGVLQGYLCRIEDFVQKLPGIYFHLKSAVKFHKLRVDIVRQDFEEQKLMQYLTDASNKSTDSSPVPSRFSNVFSFNKNNGHSQTNENADNIYVNIPLLGDCQIKEEDRLLVVEEYLTGLIAQNKLTISIESLGAYMDYHNVLKPLHAKLMLTVSPVVQESWARVLGATKYEQLVKESSIAFTPATLNISVKRGPSDPIKLSVRTKNIQRLSIRVFQINMENYSRLHLGSNEKTISDKNNKIDLDGLCPTWEKDIDFSSEPAIRVKTNDFVFGGDGLASDVFNGRGLWVIEFVGGQNQCRAIVQKGYLRHVIQDSIAGHIVRVLDENGQSLKNSKIWCGNQYYQADESDNILIPYLPYDSGSKTNNMLLISTADEFCEALSFNQLPEKYQLSADFYVNPEMVSYNKKVTVVVNPRLTMNGIPVPLSLLEKTSLVVESTNVDEVKNVSTYQNISKNSEAIYFEFMVPDRLVGLDFTLQAKIKTLNDTLQPVEAKHSINYTMPVEVSGVPESVHLKKSIDGNYFIHVFGMNGEIKAGYEVSLRIKHSFSTYRQVEVTLKTNDEGIISLGSLPNIQWIEYSNAHGAYKQWSVNSNSKCLLPPAVCISADKPFQIACSTASSSLLFSLYKTGVREVLIENVSNLIEISDSHVSISGLPEGEYMFYYASNDGGDSQMKCSVIKGQVDLSETSSDNKKNRFWSDWVIGSNSYAKQNGVMLQRPLSISDIDTSDKENVTVQLKNWSAKTFLIVTTSTFVPTNPEALSHILNGHNLTRPIVYNNGVSETKSLFLDDKKLGEEYQYVLNRARSEKWVGTSLTKPTLLMFPEKHASTTSESRLLTEGNTLKSARHKISHARGLFGGIATGSACYAKRASFGNNAESSLAFLDHKSPILILPVSTDGAVSIAREKLGFGGDLIQVIAISGEQTVYRDMVMPSDNPCKFRLNDLRQKSSSNKALIRSKVVKSLLPNEKLILSTHEYETIDSFEKLYQTAEIISPVGNSLSQNIGYLKTWFSLDTSKKLKVHEEHVCHEFNFWLKKKDPVFFDQFVRPAIKSKIRKSFMDLYLIDEDLAEFSRDMYKFEKLSTIEKALLASTQSSDFLKTVIRTFQEAFDDKKLDDRSDAIFDSILAKSTLVIPEDEDDDEEDMGYSCISETSMAQNVIKSPSYSPSSPQYSPSSPQYLCSAPRPPPAPSARSAPSAGMFGVAQSGAMFGGSTSRADRLAELVRVSEVEVIEEGFVEENDEELEEATNEMREKAKQHQKKVTYEFTKNTTEWVETGYCFKENNIAIKKFWIDFLQYHLNKNDTQQNMFLSENFMYCLGNLTEVYFVLSMLDLPLASEVNWTKETATKSNVESGDSNPIQLAVCASESHPLMVFYRTLTESSGPFNGNNENNLMLSQELFLFDENTPIQSDECIKINPLSRHLDTFVQYGSHVIISNISGKRLSCQVTVQVPTGAIPCKETPYCKSETISIEPYSTWHEVTGTFYFPSTGEFTIVPVTVSSLSGDKLLGKIDAIDIKVQSKSCNESSANDSDASNQVLSLSSWPTLANSGSNQSVISFLESYKKLNRLDFSIIGWRMKDTTFARQVFDVLSHHRCFYSQELWKYGIYHQFGDIIRDLLNFNGSHVLNKAGQVFESPLITKKVEDHSQLFDYYPLLNARAHPLKSTSHEILNDQFYKQYDEFLSYLSQRTSQATNTDLIILTLYLILQDRIGDAHLTFARIKSDVNNPIDCQIQMDYLEAYLKTRVPVTTDQMDQQLLDLQSVKEIANKYKDFGVLKWRKLFTELYEFVCEVEQGDSDITSDLSNSNAKFKSEPLLEFEINQETQELVVRFANMKSIDVKYYEMNIEVMFSTNPFMNDRTTSVITNENFTWIKPSYSSRIELPEKQTVTSAEINADDDYDMIGVGKVKSVQTLNIPFTGGNKNIFVEISSVDTPNSIKRHQAYFSHSLQTHIVESFGIVRVMSGKTKRPLAGAYVKVYARMQNSKKVNFWKDGYTGLNGVFDYIGVTEGNALMGRNGTDLKTLMENEVDKLSILVISNDEGAVVKEVYPPLNA